MGHPTKFLASLTVVVSLLCHPIDAFAVGPASVVSRTASSTGSASSLSAASSSDDNGASRSPAISSPKNAELFESEAWKTIQKDLDQIPIFTVATAEGHPIAYQVQLSADQTFTVPFFYCEVADALVELEKAKNNTEIANADNMDIVPFALGQAFELWCKDEAVIVPSKQAILQAGAPPGTNPVGQQVPMFACMEIMEEAEDGSGRLPLFMALDDANEAVQQAVDVGEDQVKREEFEVVCLSLSGAIEQLATIPETPAFHFIPASSSIRYIEEYLS